MKQPVVYILTNHNETTLYIDVTSNIQKRLYEHKSNAVAGFSSKYNLSKLVYFKQFDAMEDAILYEKYLKGKKRDFKVDLIKSMNPDWEDLSVKYEL